MRAAQEPAGSTAIIIAEDSGSPLSSAKS